MRALLIVALCLAPAIASADWRPLVFSDEGQTLGKAHYAIEAGAGYNGLPQTGTAELSDERRFDSWITAAVGVVDRVELAASLDVADVPGRGFGLGDSRFDLRVQVLKPHRRFPIAIAVGAGYQSDPSYEHALSAVVALSAQLGSRLSLTFDLRGAHYFHVGRDPLDVFLTAGALVRATSWLRLGAEYVGEELEGVGDDAADLDLGGGGRHYLGPTAVALLRGGRLRLNVTAGPVLTRTDTAALVRGSLAYLF